MPRRKLLKSTKWTCTLAAVACTALFVATRWVDVSFKGTGPRFVILRWGVVWFGDTLETYTSYGPHIDTTPYYRLWIDYEMEPPMGLVLWWVWVPLWVPALLTAVPAALLWRSEVAKRRAMPTSCAKCGYDLPGLPAATLCPECGTVRAPAAPGQESQEGRRAPFASAPEHPQRQEN